MLTTTATFDKYKMRPNAEGTFIIKIIGDTSTFYISDRVIDLPDSSIKTLAVVKSFGDISQKIDLFTKKVSISNVKLKLVNAPYFAGSSGMIPLSDKLGDEGIVNVAAAIYYWFEGITDIDDCLKVFDGLVQPMKKATPETLDLEILDNSVFYHKNIPSGLIDESTFPQSPVQARGQYIPLVYGAFTKNEMTLGGLAECHWLESNKIVLSDHVSKSVSQLWVLDENLGKLVRLDTADWSENLDDSDRTTIELTAQPKASCFIYPHDYGLFNSTDPYYDGYPFRNHENSLDRDDATAMNCTSPYLVGGHPDCDGTIRYYFHESLADGGTWDKVYAEIHYDTLDTSEVQNHVFYYYANTVNGSWNMETMDGADQWNSMDITSILATDSIGWSDICDTSDDHTDRFMIITADFNPTTGGPTEVSIVRGVRIRIDYWPAIHPGVRIFAECEGRKFGSWIDEGGRSNIFDEGDLIENPAYIIESILRDEMGLTSSDIDVSSFDDVWGDTTSWDLAINILQSICTNNLFENIGFQAKCHAYFSSQGIAKIDLIDDTVTSEDGSVVKNDISLPHIEMDQGNIKTLINSVDILYCPEGSFGFQYTLSAENSTSQSDYNITKHKTIKADFIQQSAVATLLSNHIVGSSGYWKDIQEEIKIRMLTFDKIAWEIGDRIEPDSSVNDIFELFGDDFGSATNAPLFIITEKKIGKDLRFTLQRMGDTGSGGT